MFWRILATVMLATQLFGGPAMSAERHEVALTVSLPADADKPQKDLAGTLLALLEFEAGKYPQIAVVERTQIDLALNELVLNRALNADEQTRLALNRLATADLILTARFLEPEVDGDDGPSKDREDGDGKTKEAKEEEPARVRVSIVEALTGSIRGVTVATIEETNVDEVAAQIARYLSAVIDAPQQAGVTVAVGAFDSLGRFDRLRPLELGIRDMITTGLLHVSRFQVLQRSSMEELNRELDLIRSGLADRSQLPETLPTRQAAFFFRGTINERVEGDGFVVIVTGKLVSAASGQVVQDLRFESTPEELPDGLTHFVGLVANHLIKSSAQGVKLQRAEKFDETEYLYQAALGDLRRFRRLSPIDFSQRQFYLPGEKPAGQREPIILQPDSLLGRHLLRKSIDRLESVLFIQPERAGAAYALGYCYSFHLKDIVNLKRADELLRAAFSNDPQGRIGAEALQHLAELSFHHSGGWAKASARPAAAEQIAFAFSHMPAEHRSGRWPRMLELLAGLRLKNQQARPLLKTMNSAAALAERTDLKHRAPLAKGVARLASALFLHGSPDVQSAAEVLLTRWGEGETPELSLAASRMLGYIAVGRKNHSQAIRWFLRAADVCQSRPDDESRRARANFLLHAGRSYRLAGEVDKALGLLKTIEHVDGRRSLNRGYVDVEIGACYEALGKPQEALLTYVAAAEEVPHLPDNSDVETRIRRLGGVPLREDRDFDLRYVPGPDERPNLCRILATDGRRIFCAGGYQGRHAQGVLLHDPAQGTWQEIGVERGRVTCLAYRKGQLWIGTVDDGLWRYDLATTRWKQWSADDGLPDERIVSVAAGADGVYAGVGTTASGGLVQIDAGDDVRVFDDKHSPTTAPTHLVVRGGTDQDVHPAEIVLARTTGGIHQWDRQTNTWTPLTKARAAGIFAGDGVVWASSHGKELYPFDPAGKVDEKFRSAWFPRGQGKAGYLVRFVVEHDGQIWFGGSPWQRFKSAGFYRVNSETGEFFLYGPRDGFRLSRTYETYDGVWAAGRLWIATSAGLAEIKADRLGRQR